MQFGSARPYDLTNSTNTINAGGGTAAAVIVPTGAPTNYLYGTNYINTFVSAATAADPTIDPSDATAAAQGSLANCYYSGKCTIGKYAPLRGDPFFQLDMSLAKNIRIREGMNLQLVAQAFNLTNRANYGNDFGNNIASPSTFAHPAGFINPSSTFTPRSVWSEFGVHFTF